MRILGAIGLGLTMLVLEILMPRVFMGLEQTLVQLFHLAQVALVQAETIIKISSW